MNKYVLLLNCITNAQTRGHNILVYKYSKYIFFILSILYEENFIKGFLIKNSGPKKKFYILLKYKNDKQAISTIFISDKNSRKKDLEKIHNGVSISIISTSKGLITSETACLLKIGGVLLFTIK
jgi:small subunit ribosomal protein S8